jgi:ribosomal protein S18 acetylase RimI-like enzyme
MPASSHPAAFRELPRDRALEPAKPGERVLPEPGCVYTDKAATKPTKDHNADEQHPIGDPATCVHWRMRSQRSFVAPVARFIPVRITQCLHRGMEIRQAVVDDIGFLVDVVLAATRDQGRLPAGFDEGKFRHEYGEWTRQELCEYGSGSTTYIVASDGEPVGRLRVVRSDEAIELAGIQLLPSFQNRGMGTAVVNGLKAEATERECPLDLDVERDNPRARALYERLGFAMTGETRSEFRMRSMDG